MLQFYNSREYFYYLLRGISLKFHEPPEARRPIDRWQIYIFKGDDVLRSHLLTLEPIVLSDSVYLIGKDEQICDILC